VSQHRALSGKLSGIFSEDLDVLISNRHVLPCPACGEQVIALVTRIISKDDQSFKNWMRKLEQELEELDSNQDSAD